MTALPLILGVDFSGGASAGRSAALAWGHLNDGVLTLERVCLARDLPNSDSARERCYSAIRSFIDERRPAVVGIDAPLALPAEMMLELSEADGSWERALSAIAAMADAQTLRAWCRARSAKPELKRSADVVAKTPMSPYNLRVVAQTWGAARLLAPLVASRSCQVWPCQVPAPDVPTVIETCPASALVRLHRRRPYKGKEHEAERRAMLAELCAGEWGWPKVQLSPADEVVGNAGGDLLDAVICAWLAARQLQAGWSSAELPQEAALEAWVVF